MIEIYSKSLVRAIVQSITYEIELKHPLKPIKVMKSGLYSKSLVRAIGKVLLVKFS